MLRCCLLGRARCGPGSIFCLMMFPVFRPVLVGTTCCQLRVFALRPSIATMAQQIARKTHQKSQIRQRRPFQTGRTFCPKYTDRPRCSTKLQIILPLRKASMPPGHGDTGHLRTPGDTSGATGGAVGGHGSGASPEAPGRLAHSFARTTRTRNTTSWLLPQSPMTVPVICGLFFNIICSHQFGDRF